MNRGGDGKFGTADDALNQYNPAPNSDFPAEAFVGRIGSIVIKGQALGTVGGTDSFGIVSQNVGSIKVGAYSKVLSSAVRAVPLGATGDFVARKIGSGNPALPVFADATGLTIDTQFSAHFTDVDGDFVTVKTTKQILTAANFVLVPAGNGYQLQSISIPSALAKGAMLTITAKPQDVNDDGIMDGDGFVNVGFVNAVGVPLGALKISGDVGRLLAGAADASAPAVTSLDVQSMGIFGTSTQAAGGTLASTFNGALTKVNIHSDVRNATIAVSGDINNQMPALGTIGALTLGGSLIGGDTGSGLGYILASGGIGAVKIGGDVVGGNITGDPNVVNADNSGRISSASIKSVTVLGSIYGGMGEDSGQVFAPDGIGTVMIGRDLRGGAGDESGAVYGGVAVGAVTVGGSLIGGAGEESGAIRAPSSGGVVKSIKIAGDVLGGAGEESGYLNAFVKLGQITIGGSLIGSSGKFSGFLYAGANNAELHTMEGVSIGGNMIGGTGLASGSLGTAFSQAGQSAALDMGPLVIKGSAIGAGQSSAAITANKIASLNIGGNMIGSNPGSASVAADAAIGTVNVGGSIVGGSQGSGYLLSHGAGSVTVGHDVRGGAGMQSGSLFLLRATTLVTLGGSLESGVGFSSGAIQNFGGLGALTIKGSVWGSAAEPAEIAVEGLPLKTTPSALGKLTIGGSAEFLNVLGGYYLPTSADNAEAQLGAISVGGTWRGGSIISGIKAGSDGFFGTNDDAPITVFADAATHSKIASITIKGRAFGTVGGADAFGFAAEEIGAVKIGAVTFKLKTGAFNDNETLPAADAALLSASSTGDLRIRELKV